MQVLNYLCVGYKQKQLTPLTVYQYLDATYKPKEERFVYFLNTARIVQIRTWEKALNASLIIKTPQRTVQIYYNFPSIVLFIYQFCIIKPCVYHWYKTYKTLYINRYSCVMSILTKQRSKLYWLLLLNTAYFSYNLLIEKLLLIKSKLSFY